MKYFSPQSTRRQGLKPPALYEYFLDNFWFKAAGLENEVINEPLRGSHKADVVIIGGSDSKYYHNDGIAPGNNKSVSQEIVKDLTRTFPSLAGTKVEHAWGGPTAGSLDFTPSVGVMGEHGNIYYGVGYNEGVPSTQTGGRIIADLMAGEKNEFTSHFIVNKKIPYAGPKVLRSFFGALKKTYMVNVVKHTRNY